MFLKPRNSVLQQQLLLAFLQYSLSKCTLKLRLFVLMENMKPKILCSLCTSKPKMGLRISINS